MSRKIRVFISYSHQDAKYLEEDSLWGFLKGIQQEGIAEFWSNKQIATGELWDDEIKAKIVDSDIALVLVSQAFLNSSYCTDVEIGSFIARKVFIFPVILSACEWQRHKWLHSRQFLPGGEKNIEEHYIEPGCRKGLFLEILKQLRRRIEQLANQGPRRLLEAQQTVVIKPALLVPLPDQFIHGWSTAQVQALQKQTAEALGLPVVFRDKFKDGGEGPELVLIPGGEFLMGSSDADKPDYDNPAMPQHHDEKPQHRVAVSTFYMARFPVTRELYRKIRHKYPSQGENDDPLPATGVSWFDAVQFCNVLSERCGLQPCYWITGEQVEWDRDVDGYRLPTEAEWEYAARAGQVEWDGDVDGDVDGYNAWGLYDMIGNVWEWCWDWYGPYLADAAVDGPNSGDTRVLRGGTYWYIPWNQRSLYRSSSHFHEAWPSYGHVVWSSASRVAHLAGRLRSVPKIRDGDIGFRCVRGPRRQP